MDGYRELMRKIDPAFGGLGGELDEMEAAIERQRDDREWRAADQAERRRRQRIERRRKSAKKGA